MELQALTAISPIDGRYRQQLEEFAPYFSEFGLMRYRLLIEVEYFIALCEYPLPQLKGISPSLFNELRVLYEAFTEKEAQKIKTLENTTNHDVKAVEYYLKDKLNDLDLSDYKEFVHFGLTSQDINNTATPLLILDALTELYIPLLSDLIDKIATLADQWIDVPMLSRTHGQPASPTLLGKELLVFWDRLSEQLSSLEELSLSGKFGGAVGNFNAHFAAYPDIDWFTFAEELLDHLGLNRQLHTTQISHYDDTAALCDNLKRINTILIDACRDIWTYISQDYFSQALVKGEVGSSTMPHKVNPINFENAEGNFGIANALYTHLAAKLPISRLQRDLTDSTVLRNIGVPIAHSYLALNSMLKGLNKLQLNHNQIQADLNKHWEVVTEGIQTILRREGYPNPYETLKQLSRTGAAITKDTIAQFIDTLEVSQSVKNELKALSPSNYTGKIHDINTAACG